MAEWVLRLELRRFSGGSNEPPDSCYMFISMNNTNQTIMENTIDYCRFFVVKRIPEQVSSFVFNLAVPTVIFTLTKSSYQFVMELLSTKIEINFDEVLCKKKKKEFARIGDLKIRALCEKVNALENRPLWIDDTEFHSVTELCEKCHQIVKEHQIQVVIIDDYYHLTVPNSEEDLVEKQDSAGRQLRQLTNELDILTVAFAYTS